MESIMWNTFKTMPECNRPLIIAYTSEDQNETASAHLFFGYADENAAGFGASVIIHETDALAQTSGMLSRARHAELRERGKWAYVVDVLRTSGVAAMAPEPNIYTNGDRPFEGCLKGVPVEF